MLFNSIEFAIFLPIVFLLYWFVFTRDEKYQSHKIGAYLSGLETLHEKGCRLVMLSFPFFEELERDITDSHCRHLSENLINQVSDKYNLISTQINVGRDSLLMHDLSHMNEIGANRLTDSLLHKGIIADTSNILVKISF